MIIKLREGAITSLKKQNFDRETFLAMERVKKEKLFLSHPLSLGKQRNRTKGAPALDGHQP